MNLHITKNIMVDLETFGPRPNGLIVSIGAVCFSTNESDYLNGKVLSGLPQHEFHQALNFEIASFENRFVKSPVTMDWWENKQPEAFATLKALMTSSPNTTKNLLCNFLEWLTPFCEQGYNIIGNSPSFDLVLLENACNVLGLQFPVPYRAETDYRSITDLVFGPEKPRPGQNIAHDALHDAKFQAELFAKALYTVNAWRNQAIAA